MPDARPLRILRAGTHALLLGVALVFVGLVAYLPHLFPQDLDPSVNPWDRMYGAYADWASGERDDYEYPIHVDSNVHWVKMAAIERSGSLRHPDPYTGAEADDSPLSMRGLVHETGFWVAFVTLHDLTGLSYPDIMRIAPVFWSMLSAWLVWAALRPWSGAPVAAALVALVPTSVRFLGPAFFVPSGFGLCWIAAVLLLARHASRDRAALLLTLMLGAWAFFIHLIDGFAAFLLLVLMVPFFLAGTRRNLILLVGGLVLPMAWFYDSFTEDFGFEIERLGDLPIDVTILDQLGLPFLFLWVAGCALMVLRPPPPALRATMSGAALFSILAFTFLVLNVAFEVRRYALYDRWHQPFALLATIPVAYAILAGFTAARELLLRWQKGLTARSDPRRARALRLGLGPFAIVAAGLLVFGATVAVATPGLDRHLAERQYRILDEGDWERFMAARDLPDTHEVFLAHPWKAPVYAAMSGKRPLAWLSPGAPPVNGADYGRYLSGGNADPVWMVDREIAIVLDPYPPDGAWYVQDASGAWLLDEAAARELRAIQDSRGR